MKVYLVRHTSVDVAPGTCYGQTDVPLRASFQEEAEACKKALQDTGMRFSRIYTSPLSRCTHLAAYCGFPEAERDERLKEMNMGEWEMQRFEEITDPRIQEWYDDYLRVRTTGGESFMDVLARVGRMREDFFIDFVDVEWCLRARFEGHPVYGVCTARLEHRLGDEPVKFLGREYLTHSPRRHYFHVRNAVLLYREPWVPLNWKLVSASRLVLKMGFHVLVTPPRLQHLARIASGFLHGLLGRTGAAPD